MSKGSRPVAALLAGHWYQGVFFFVMGQLFEKIVNFYVEPFKGHQCNDQGQRRQLPEGPTKVFYSFLGVGVGAWEVYPVESTEETHGSIILDIKGHGNCHTQKQMLITSEGVEVGGRGLKK